MNVLVSGASGLIGSHLVRHLTAEGHSVYRLVRRKAADSHDLAWNPQAEPGLRALCERFGGIDAVVHLAGESIMGRWTAEKKARIRDSRVTSTGNLARAIAGLPVRPRVFAVASAIGYYGSRGGEILTEESKAGDGFLPDVCRAWEQAAEPAVSAGIRVVNLRIGVVLTPEGGALKQMLVPFRMGVGGVTGSGRQWMSWISVADAVKAIAFALENETLSGPVNLTAPHPVTNAEFTKVLAEQLHRPAVVSVPAFAVKLLFGEMGEALLLGSQRVLPASLQKHGYVFEHTQVRQALAAALR